MTPRAMACFLCWMHARMPREKESLFQILPEHLRAALQQQPIPRGLPEQILESLSQRLEPMHHSWIPPLPGLVGEPQTWRDWFASLPELAVEFWQRWLWQQVSSHQWLPKALLPEMGEWEPLLQLEKQQLVELIDILGLFDVVVNLRRAVHPEEQQIWAQALSPQQKHAAQKLLQLPNWPGQAPLPLTHSSPKEVNRQIHTRGCIRLGAALHGLNEGFLWYIAHRLDRGRGDLVQKSANSSVSPEALQTARRSVLWALQELTKDGAR